MFDKIISLYAPFRCVGCGSEKNLLVCEDCVQTIARVPSRCYACRSTTRNYETCRKCQKRVAISSLKVFGRYDGLVKELVKRSKFSRAKRGIYEMAELILDRFSIPSDRIIVPIPTATSRVRSRGYDHAVVLAKVLAKSQNAQYLSAFLRIGQSRQVGSKRIDRVNNIKGALRLRSDANIVGQNIILVDDVCTTGATLEEAARILRKAGAKRVEAMVFAQPN